MNHKHSRMREPSSAAIDAFLARRDDSPLQRALDRCSAAAVYLFGLAEWAASCNHGHLAPAAVSSAD